MLNSFHNTSHRLLNDSKEITDDNRADNSKDYKVIYTNDSDGAYHVEQDDETEEDAMLNKAL